MRFLRTWFCWVIISASEVAWWLSSAPLRLVKTREYLDHLSFVYSWRQKALFYLFIYLFISSTTSNRSFISCKCFFSNTVDLWSRRLHENIGYHLWSLSSGHAHTHTHTHRVICMFSSCSVRPEPAVRRRDGDRHQPSPRLLLRASWTGPQEGSPASVSTYYEPPPRKITRFGHIHENSLPKHYRVQVVICFGCLVSLALTVTTYFEMSAHVSSGYN